MIWKPSQRNLVTFHLCIATRALGLRHLLCIFEWNSKSYICIFPTLSLLLCIHFCIYAMASVFVVIWSSDILPVTVTLKCHSCDLQTGWGHCERQAGGEVEIGRERAQNGKRQNSSSCFYLPPFFPVCVCIIRQVWIVVCMCVCVFVCQCVCPPGCVGQMHLTKNTIGVTHGSEWVANSAQHAHTHTHTRTRTNIRTHACLCVFVRTI